MPPAALDSLRYWLLVRQMRDEGLSQQEVAAKLGVSQSSISNYERGQKPPDVDTIAEARRRLKIAARFFTDPSLGNEPKYRDYIGAAATESIVREAPESFRRWRKTEAPASLDPEVEAEMLAIYASDRLPWADVATNVEPWTEVYRLAKLSVQYRKTEDARGGERGR